jgi:hypothetical protein
MRASKAILVAGCAVLAFQASTDACEWSNPIWAKDRKSDTPLFCFVVNGQQGYIDSTGKIVIPARLLTLGNWGGDDFFEGVVRVRDTLLDAAGSPIRLPGLSPAGRFSEGLLPVASGDNNRFKYGYADHQGKLIIAAQFDTAEAFSEGLAAVEINGRWGYVDRSGKMVIPARFCHAEQFSDGAADRRTRALHLHRARYL